jgi:hypothetical protein
MGWDEMDVGVVIVSVSKDKVIKSSYRLISRSFVSILPNVVLVVRVTTNTTNTTTVSLPIELRYRPLPLPLGLLSVVWLLLLLWWWIIHVLSALHVLIVWTLIHRIRWIVIHSSLRDTIAVVVRICRRIAHGLTIVIWILMGLLGLGGMLGFTGGMEYG